MIRKRLAFSLFWGLLGGSQAIAGCLQLRITVRDHTTRQHLTARFAIRNADGISALEYTADSQGNALLDIECPATILIVEKDGYRSQSLQLNASDLQNSESPISLIVPLVRADQQGRDQPYLQTEQTHYEQSPGGKSGKAYQKSLLSVTDAIDHTQLAAQACFFFTRLGRKECLEVVPDTPSEMTFTEKDIVAVEVNAPGYQTYRGNIAVEKLDNNVVRQPIGLLRELVILSVKTGETGLECTLRPQGSSAGGRLTAFTDQPGSFCAADLNAGVYELAFAQPGGKVQHRQTISLQKGLNFLSIPAFHTAPAETDSLPALQLPAVIPPIYFLQSSYELRPDSQNVLLRIADFLQNNPAYKIRFMGHTDNVGTEQRNLILSELRAQVAANFLFNRGVDSKRLYKKGMGSRQPAAANDSEENKIKNRRVTIELFVDR